MRYYFQTIYTKMLLSGILCRTSHNDSSFCTKELLSGVTDNCCQKLDNSAIGIHGTLSSLYILKLHDLRCCV
jgi:hypothetical protein